MYWGLIGIMEKNLETTTLSWVYIGVIVGDKGIYWGSIGIMERKMETTTLQ